jgi:hypothetical protein
MVQIKPFDVASVIGAVTSLNDKKIISFTYANHGYANFVINLATSLLKAGCQWKLLVFCLDHDIKNDLMGIGNVIPISFYSDVSTNMESYNTVPYKQIVLTKLDIFASLQAFLAKLNSSVTHIFYIDSDVVIFKDPLPYLVTNDADLVMQCGEKLRICTSHSHEQLHELELCINCCTGVVFSKVSNKLLQMFSYENIDPSNTEFDGDQDYINAYLKKDKNDISVLILPVELFPNGFWCREPFSDKYLLHYNYMFAEHKIPMMKYNGHWFSPQEERKSNVARIFRPEILVNYPPWADELLEPYFYDWIGSKMDQLKKNNWVYLDVFWTNLYVNADQFGNTYDSVGLQSWLDRLPPGNYFTIVQHDDGIRERLPSGTVVFALGGARGRGFKLEPVPLIYRDHSLRLENYFSNNEARGRDIFCSFVGSITHAVRHRMVSIFNNYPDVKLHVTNWSNQVSTDNQAMFLDLTQRSVFALCPRGYGATSFRFYEAFKLGAIPVYIWEEHEWLPFRNKIDYSKLCISVPSSELPNLYERLKKVTPHQIWMMKYYYQTVKRYFTMEGTSETIVQMLTDVSDPYVAISERLRSASSTLCFEIEQAGFGAMMSRIMTGLGIALEYQMKPSFRMNGCKYKCPFDLGWGDTYDNTVSFEFETVPPNTVARWDFFRYFSTESLFKRFQYPEPPPFFNHPTNRSMIRHYWSACLMGYIAKHADPRLKELIASTKSSTGWPTGGSGVVIGMHIRRGDKITENPYIPVEVYVTILHQLMTSRNIASPTVFLTSDDANVYQELKNALGPIPILWDSNEKRYNNANYHFIETSNEIAEQESYTAAKNILLLGDCDYVIGSHNTQTTWLGGLVCVANHQGDANRHIMIHSKNYINGKYTLSHWACDYLGFESPLCPAAVI